MSVNGAAIVAEAQRFLGDRYVYATSGPTTFDCSGLAQYVYKQLGITIPRTSQEQFAQLPAVPADQAQPGDLVFFGGGGPGYFYDGTPAAPGHVGIYIGDGKMINALNQNSGVLITSTAGAVGYRRPAGVAAGDVTTADVILPPGIQPSDPNLTGGGSGSPGSIGNGLLSIPGDIVQFFTDLDQYAADAYNALRLFFQPSTYVRIGAGLFGAGFVLAGLLLLMREAKNADA